MIGINDSHARIVHVGLHGRRFGVNSERERIGDKNDHNAVARETSELFKAKAKHILEPALHCYVPCSRTSRRASKRNVTPNPNKMAISLINALASSPLANTPRLM